MRVKLIAAAVCAASCSVPAAADNVNGESDSTFMFFAVSGTCTYPSSCSVDDSFSFTRNDALPYAMFQLQEGPGFGNAAVYLNRTQIYFPGYDNLPVPPGVTRYYHTGQNLPLLAGANANVLRITGTSNPDGSIHDSASGVVYGTFLVTGVPEPATWAMMLLGFGCIGLAVRKRNPGMAQVHT